MGKEIFQLKISDKLSFLNLKDFSSKIGELKERKEATTSEFLETIFAGALFLKASDVHFEPSRNEIALRVRLDGLLYNISSIPLKTYKYLIGRVKVLAGLKINISDTAQDGRFTIFYGQGTAHGSSGLEIEIRTSINPSEFGESIVLRILNPEAIALEFEALGFREDDVDIALKELKKPNGAILVTGPTGSGKTTTLYAFLKKIRTSEKKIVTIEDPIEYHLSGVQQTQVDEQAGYTFENGLKSILRQDPDVILIGEIRDLPTAEIATHAALTGHLVFSTLHTNDAIGAIPRLIDLGINPQLIGPALNLIIAQRLLRRLCDNCKEEIEITKEISDKIRFFLEKLSARVNKGAYKSPKIYKSKGCEECSGAGYKGRVGIYELFQVNRDFDNLLASNNISESKIEEQAISQGFVYFQIDGILKALNGITSFDEIERITGPLCWNLFSEGLPRSEKQFKK